VVMSATLESTAVSAFLDGCPVVDVPGRVHPLDVSYAPGQSVVDAAIEALSATTGQVLCFLPGAAEIRRAVNELQARVGGSAVEIVPLHGSLDADAQDLVLRPTTRRRIIVATNLAETSLTVPGVTAVVDAGLHKVARYDAERGIDSLETERITADAADQRAGRAGRVAPGIVRRLWDARDRLRPHREPEICRVDLAGTALDVIAWGGDPRTFEWFEAPRDGSLDAALALLERLGVIGRPTATVAGHAPDARGSDAARSSRANVRYALTPVGEQVRRLPLHPRLARMLVTSGGARQIAQACALLSERHMLPTRTATTSSDLLSAIDDWHSVPLHVKRVADEIVRIADFRLQIAAMVLSETEFCRAILSGYPDRVAQRREPGAANVRLASGAGAMVGAESGVRTGEFLVALDVHTRAGPRVPQAAPQPVRHVVRRQGPVEQPPHAVIRIASRVEREWLQPTSSEILHRVDDATGNVRAVAVDRYDALVLAERPVPTDPQIAAGLLADAWIARGPGADDIRLLQRMKFAGHDVNLDALVRTAASGARTLAEVDIARALPAEVLRALDRDAPDSLLVPSGRHRRLEYHDDGSVSAEVKLQEVFGLAETPRIGRRREPVVLALTAPNGRPVQITRDLRSFWNRTYPEVRKELRGRYPKHPWPEDPWTAQPTARVNRKVKS
jgi:ATP-dependent helicase HrpB